MFDVCIDFLKLISEDRAVPGQRFFSEWSYKNERGWEGNLETWRPGMLIYCSGNVANTEIVTIITHSFLLLPLMGLKLGYEIFCLMLACLTLLQYK